MAVPFTQPSLFQQALDAGRQALRADEHVAATATVSTSGVNATAVWQPTAAFSLTSFAGRAWGAGGWTAALQASFHK